MHCILLFGSRLKKDPAIIECFFGRNRCQFEGADNSYTPLMQVARDGRDQVVELLLAADVERGI